MPLGPVGTAAAILLLTLLAPVAFRYAWPGGVARPSLFLVVTLTLALIVAAIAVSWFLHALVGVGISGGTADSTARFETQLRNRFFSAAIGAVLAQYWLCRATQFFLGR
jgi:hypothetical protein